MVSFCCFLNWSALSHVYFHIFNIPRSYKDVLPAPSFYFTYYFPPKIQTLSAATGVAADKAQSAAITAAAMAGRTAGTTAAVANQVGRVAQTTTHLALTAAFFPIRVMNIFLSLGYTITMGAVGGAWHAVMNATEKASETAFLVLYHPVDLSPVVIIISNRG